MAEKKQVTLSVKEFNLLKEAVSEGAAALGIYADADDGDFDCTCKGWPSSRLCANCRQVAKGGNALREAYRFLYPEETP